MSKQRLHAAVPGGMASSMGYTGIPLGPFSSNLFLFIDGRPR
jgi:hypothetical protein